MPLSYATRQVADPPLPQMKQQMSKQQKHLSRISPQWYADWTYFGMMMLWSCHKSQTVAKGIAMWNLHAATYSFLSLIQQQGVAEVECDIDESMGFLSTQPV